MKHSTRTKTVFTLFTLWGLLLIARTVSGQSIDPALPDPALPAGIASERLNPQSTPDQRVRRFLTPKRIVWKSAEGVTDEAKILDPVLLQTSTAAMNKGFTMAKKGDAECAILLDFGAEFHGGVRLEARDLTPGENSVGKSVRVRVRYGESADEAMAEPGEKGAVNEHSVRDIIVNVPWLGAIEIGESAFRFVRLDLVDPDTKICFDSIRGVFTYRDIPQIGSFRCSDERLNAIWATAAYTQLLTMQNYVFEGAKRDRLVWYGDFNPQTMTTLNVFGAPQVLRDTLGRYAETVWPLPNYMNGFPNYSLWWLISVSDFYRYSGDLDEVKARSAYVFGLFDQIKKQVAENGEAGFDAEFLDWPTADNKPALRAGTHALFTIAVERVKEIAEAVGNDRVKEEAELLLTKLHGFIPDNVGNKQAAALMTLAGLEDPAKPNVEVVAKNGGENFSTFYGYYMLEALAAGGQKQVALDVIREYWGKMIDVGATTFWEDFDLKWLENSGRIDELTPPGKKSLHGDHGAYCYIGFRHSLCHGWASGPAAWLSRHVLGVTPAEPGFKKVKIDPFLGDLDWAEGTIPTPTGYIKIRCDKNPDGTIKTDVSEVTLP